MPLLAFLMLPHEAIVAGVMVASLICLSLLGALAAWAGGAPMLRGAVRVVTWSALAMSATALVGRWLGMS